MNPAKSHESSQKKDSSTASTTSGVSSTSSARSEPAKMTNEAMKELASLFFQIKRAESAGKLLSEEQQQKAQKLVQDLKSVSIEFYGIIAKCWISGNDCHMLDSKLEIMKHFAKSEPIAQEFEKARSLIPGLPPQVVGLMVYSHEIQYLYVDGTVQTAEKNHA